MAITARAFGQKHSIHILFYIKIQYIKIKNNKIT